MWLIEIIGNFAPMKKIVNVLFAMLMITLTACENEVELNGEYEETAIVYALFDASADTHFVRINKTFLEKGESALDLAQNPDYTNYDSLKVTLTDLSDASIVILDRIKKPKDPGVFTSEENILYYTTMPLQVGGNYKLEAELPDGKIVSATTTVINSVDVARPASNTRVNFISPSGLSNFYSFRVNYFSDIARFDVKVFFLYEEVIDGQYYPRRVEVPVSSINNTRLVTETNFTFDLNVNSFFSTLARKVPNTTTRKEIKTEDNLVVEVYAADETLMFYKNVNEPIEGLSQVQPEYSNVENGLGLVASRSFTRVVTQLHEETVDYLTCDSEVKDRGWIYELRPTGDCN